MTTPARAPIRRPQASTPDVIDSFSGEFSFLSNFHQAPFAWRGRRAQTSEHHYNAAKTLIPEESDAIYALDTPGKVKRAGEKLTLQPGWHEAVKVPTMESILRAKFAPGSALAKSLVGTGNALLIEGNDWHDQYWGQCSCERHYHWAGGNHLGQVLMAIRGDLQASQDPLSVRTTRIGAVGHRPQSLTPDQRTWVAQVLPRIMRDLQGNHGAEVAISGMGLGVDTMWAETALDEGLRLWAYVPCETQASQWSASEQSRWMHLLGDSSRRLLLGAQYSVEYMRSRDDFIVRDSDVLVVVHREGRSDKSVAHAMRRAQIADLRIIYVNATTRRISTITAAGEKPWEF